MNKVLIITTTLESGGAERLVVDIAKALTKNQYYRPIVCSLFNKGILIEELKEVDVEYTSLNFSNIKNVFKNISAMRQLIKKYQPKIIHSHQFASDFYGSIASLGLGVPVISHIHNPDERGSFFRKISRYITRYFISLLFIDYFISTVEEKIKNLNKILPSTKKRTFILYNAIDPNNLYLPSNFKKHKYREKFDIPKESFVIGSVGRISWEKGYDLLILAFAKTLKHDNKRKKLVLVGDGPELENLKNLSNNLGISNKVIFAGYQENVAQWMSIFDIFVASSRMESFSIASLEAMYLGLPVIITDRFSSKDILSYAAMVTPCSVKGLQDGILKLIKNSELQKEMTKKGKKMIEDNFTIDKYIKKLEYIYKEVLKNFNDE